MVTFRSLVISILPLILLSASIDASRYRPVRQKRADECPNPNANTCLFVTCENGGVCFEDPTTLDCFKCQCTAGYTGKVCDTPIVTTPSVCNPGCQNGGFCNVNICECPKGYTGASCEIIDFCLPINPCQNGGRCISTSVNYQCDCKGTGYTGTVCTDVIPANPCASNPCQNGGQCSWDGVTMNCVCYNDYIGVFCQIPPAPCASAPCENGGTCELLATNTYGCVCPAEFTGARCETSIVVNHPCVVNPTALCFNGGTCTLNGVDYLCKCAPGWTGTSCEIQEVTSSCSPNPCGVHGDCYPVNISIGLTVYCYCENRWTGKFCDVNMDEGCPVGYCITGTCQMIGNVPQCDCPALYTGQRCETFLGPSPTTTDTTLTNLPITTTPPIGVNGCFSSPCKNGGTCYGNTDTYRCECVEPWSGPLCDVWSGTITTTDYSTVTPDINGCSLSPCYNGGTCYPSDDNSFMCVCTAEFTGTLCETTETATVPSLTTTDVMLTTTDVPLVCANQPCQNGGTCVAVGASYSCFCGLTSIYTGKNCDSTAAMTIDECPLDCTPGRCIFSGNAAKPYACLWNGIMRPIDGTTG